MNSTLNPQQMLAFMNLQQRLQGKTFEQYYALLIKTDFHVGRALLEMKQCGYTEEKQCVPVFALTKEGNFECHTEEVGVFAPRLRTETREINAFIAEHNAKKRRREE